MRTTCVKCESELRNYWIENSYCFDHDEKTKNKPTYYRNSDIRVNDISDMGWTERRYKYSCSNRNCKYSSNWTIIKQDCNKCIEHRDERKCDALLSYLQK